MSGPAPGGDGCALYRPTYVRLPPREFSAAFAPGERPGDYDRMTTQTVESILVNNETWQRSRCGQRR